MMKIGTIDPNWVGSGSVEEEIYKENILDHYKNPRNFGELESFTFSVKDSNPLCGDQFELFLRIDGGKVAGASFRGSGCAISTAATSMLTNKIMGMSVEEVREISKEEILEMIGISLDVVRLKCGLLSFNILNKGMKEREVKNV
jgi:nitrogen fixation protein NifU and related proteins